MAVFHLFPCLPSELRARIWELTVEPRTIEVGYKNTPYNETLHVMSSAPVPAILQTCYEARNQKGLYQRAFAFGIEPRYVWVNFEVDMISIGHHSTFAWELFEAERLLIRRLTFEGENDEWFFHFRYHQLAGYSNLEVIHVICYNGVDDWQTAWESIHWPCGPDNVRFIDRETGEVALGKDLDDMLPRSSCSESE
ncbi:uncharacterized protein GIQ15_03402 [Arthroderma uncinatum]|uniref:uncharacterized protein n=1 Tax=Arthroderma uncinatum TaxID=74035 RepID=UPI00144ADC8D|nr:uncharacterized protein GIQ15_03402 [Arthroderma uncinatum]KAF3484078.1 hypothetical protein GIQ15_03402 [Arthroderma uncinatum]